MKQPIIIVQQRISVVDMIRTFKNKRTAGADGLLGEGAKILAVRRES